MAQVDHDRRRLALDGAELGLLAALAGDAAGDLAARPEATARLASLERAGALRDGRPAGWPGDLARTVARPEARLEVEHAPGTGPPGVAHRLWVAGEHAVVGRTLPEDRFELALVRRSLAVLALLRALGLAAEPEDGPRGWRVTGGIDPEAEPSTLVAPVDPAEAFAALAARLGMPVRA